MRMAREWVWRLFATLRRGKLDREMKSELQFHLDMEAEAARERGVPVEEAARAARLRAGSVSGAMEELRDQRGLAWLDGSFGDLRQAASALRRRAGFTTLAAGALALAVAANTLIFSILDGVLLRPLPYPHPERLIRIFASTERNPKWPISVGDYLEHKRESRSLESIGLYTREDVELMHGDVPERLPAVKITDDFFPTLGVQPVLGRNFHSSELHDSARIAIMSHRLWTTRFHSDPTIVGRTIKINRESWTIAGVLPADFQHIGGAFRSPLQGDTVALWWPLGIQNIKEPGLRGWHFTNAVARVKPGVSIEQANQDLNRVAADLAKRYPDWNGGTRARIAPLVDEVVGSSRQTVLLVAAAGALVLLIACANIAGLCIARGLARRREIAIRQALGAPFYRLVRVVLAENLVLGAVGGVAGLLLTAALLPVLRIVLPEDFPRAHEIGMSWAGIAFALSTAILTSILAGLIAAFRQAQRNPSSEFRHEDRATSLGRQATRLRSALVVGEVALASVLSIGSVLLLRSSLQLEARSHGFNPDGVLTFQNLAAPKRVPAAPGDGCFIR